MPKLRKPSEFQKLKLSRLRVQKHRALKKGLPWPFPEKSPNRGGASHSNEISDLNIKKEPNTSDPEFITDDEVVIKTEKLDDDCEFIIASDLVEVQHNEPSSTNNVKRTTSTPRKCRKNANITYETTI